MLKKLCGKKGIALLGLTAVFALTAGLGAAFLPRSSARAAGEPTVDLDFTTDDGGVFEEHNGTSWTVEKGVYHASTASAITKTKEKFDLSETIYFSFDFYVTAAPFDVYFTPDLANGGYNFGGGFGVHVFSSSFKTLTVNGYMDLGAWIGDNTTYYVDGKAHNMKIAVTSEGFSVFVDNTSVSFGTNKGSLSVIPFEGITGLDSGNQPITGFNETKQAQVCFKAADTTSYIDNFKVSNTDIDYVPPVQPEIPEEPIDLDFAADDGGVFEEQAFGGWVVGNGAYHPAQAATSEGKSIAKTKRSFDLTKPLTISFDFYAETPNFDVFLAPAFGWNEGDGFTVRVCFNTADADRLNICTAIDGQGYLGDYVGKFSGGNASHNMKIDFDGTAFSVYMDGAETPVEFNNGAGTSISLEKLAKLNEEKKAFIFLRATETASYIDNFKVTFPSAQPEPPEPPTPTDPIDLDFESDDGGKFTATGDTSGWTVKEGKYYPAANFAATYLSQAIDLTTTTYISFDFFVDHGSFDQAEGFFSAALLPDASDIRSGFGIHCYYSYGAAVLTVNGAGLDKNVWIQDYMFNWDDGKVHNLKLEFTGKSAYFWIDNTAVTNGSGTTEFTNTIAGDTAYFALQAASADCFIDNFKVSPEDIEYVAPVQPDLPEPPEPSAEPIKLDFTAKADGEKFAVAGAGGWTVDGGKFYPAQDYGATYLIQPIDLTKTTYISFDFLAAKGTFDPSIAQFNIALLPNISDLTSGFGIHCYYYEGASQVLTINSGGLEKLGWIADYPFDWNDNREHDLMMRFGDGTGSFRIDNTLIAAEGTTEFSNPISGNTAYLAIQGYSAMSSIDNFELSFEPIEYVAPEELPTLQPCRDEFTEDAGNFVVGGNDGWQVSDGAFAPARAWSATQYKHRIPLTGECTITFDFVSKGEQDGSPVAGAQFNFGLVRGPAAADGTGVPSTALALHLYREASVQLRLSNFFGDVTSRQIADPVVHDYFDGEVHRVKLVVNSGTISVVIDNEVLFRGIPLDMDAAYFTVQSSTADTRIDNFSLTAGGGFPRDARRLERHLFPAARNARKQRAGGIQGKARFDAEHGCDRVRRGRGGDARGARDGARCHAKTQILISEE